MSTARVSTSKYYAYTTRTAPVCFEVTWTFMEYNRIIMDRPYCIMSFRPATQCDWTLSLRRYYSSGAKMLSVDLVNKLKYVAKMDVALTLLTEDGQPLLRKEKRDVILKEDATSMAFELRNRQGQLDDLSREFMRFNMRFLLKQPKTSADDDAIDFAGWRGDTKSRMIEQLTNFVTSEHPGTVTLRTSDGLWLSANKALLCCRSPVFGKMFEHPTRERLNDEVLIDDVSSDTVKILVEFLTRSGELDLSMRFKDLKELYYASDKYEVLDVREMCATALTRVLSKKNVQEVLELADRHADPSLASGCLAYLADNLMEIQHSACWRALRRSHPKLLEKALKKTPGSASTPDVGPDNRQKPPGKHRRPRKRSSGLQPPKRRTRPTGKRRCLTYMIKRLRCTVH